MINKKQKNILVAVIFSPFIIIFLVVLIGCIIDVVNNGFDVNDFEIINNLKKLVISAIIILLLGVVRIVVMKFSKKKNFTKRYIDNPLNSNDEISVSGAALVSKNIINKKSIFKYCARRKPTSSYDTGWVFMSEIDDDKYCGNDDNFEIMSYADIIEKIEPAVAFICNTLPIGSRLVLHIENGKKYFIDDKTGEELVFKD